MVTLHKLGLVGTGAGIDRSNVAKHDDGLVVLLPEDPDASARRIRGGIGALTGRRVAVIVSDSLGSPSREDAFGAAIGLAGIRNLEEPSEWNLFGNPSAPLIDRVDEIASAVSILMGQSATRQWWSAAASPYTIDEDASIRRLLLARQVALPGGNGVRVQVGQREVAEAGQDPGGELAAGSSAERGRWASALATRWW